MNRSSNRIY